MKSKNFPLICTVILFFLYANGAWAATVNAGTCSATDVQNAINSAANGDTVMVSPGTCSWSNGVTIPSSKGITVNGNQATISGQMSIQAGSATSRVTNFNFTGTNSVQASGPKTAAPYRIDHNTFTSTSGGSILVELSGNGPGLFDHNTLNAPTNSEMIHNYGMGADSTAGWSDDVQPGGPNMVFIEDNTFINNNVSGSPAYFFGNSSIQAYYGARTVIRHNTLTMSQIDEHGTPGAIGARWWEIYENTFNMVPNGNQSQYMQIRAGSGVIFNNHKTGSTNLGGGAIELVEEDSGYPALYQIGRGVNESTSPAYVWGNDSSLPVESGSSNVVQGRDYFLSATQPASMVRDQSASDGSSTSYSYTPYTYPHPLQGQAAQPPVQAQAPQPPSGLAAVVQ